MCDWVRKNFHRIFTAGKVFVEMSLQTYVTVSMWKIYVAAWTGDALPVMESCQSCLPHLPLSLSGHSFSPVVTVFC